jgi:nucleoside-diphosphate-sugar epimerase/SAM-dependent methyltransferase
VRILVTGHDGYIGTVLVPMLRRSGHTVSGLDSLLFRECGYGPEPEEVVHALALDVRDVQPNHLRDLDAVIHLAAISNDPLGDLNPACTEDINVRGTIRLAAAAKKAGVARFVFSSSCSLYGAHGEDPIDECAEFRPVTPYGVSKVVCEQALGDMADDRFSPTYLRNATAFGLSPRLRIDLVVNNLTGFAAATGEVLLKSDGTPWRPLVHVADVARAFLAVAEAPRDLVHGQAFNVGNTEENYRIRDVAAIVEEVVPGSVVRFAPGAGPDRRSYRVDCSKLAQTLPAAVPHRTVRQGVEELFRAFQRFGLSREQLQGPLLRIEHVKALQFAGRLDDTLRWSSPIDRGDAVATAQSVGTGLHADAGVRCRSCLGERLLPFLDLGKTPLADALVRPEAIGEPEDRFPLQVAFCPDCTLVQILHEVPPERLFVDNYQYFSSWADDLLAHARRHAEELIASRGLGPHSLVIELASNDGYLLRNFVDHGIGTLGIDPAPGQAAAARAVGVTTLERFFGTDVAGELVAAGRRADVIIANNVMAHVPNLNGFVAGMATLLADDGVITIENPYVRDLVDRVEFDTIYHEHFCYFSCTAVDALMRRHGLCLNDVEHFPELHGGTLRWTVSKRPHKTAAVGEYLDAERAIGLTAFDYYAGFGARVDSVRNDLLKLLGRLRAGGARIAAYGAAAKGSTLLNFLGVGPDLINFVVDRNPHKQGMLMPGAHIPIRSPVALAAEQPDYVLLLAWNFADEIFRQQAEFIRSGGRFVVPVPVPRVIS